MCHLFMFCKIPHKVAVQWMNVQLFLVKLLRILEM